MPNSIRTTSSAASATAHTFKAGHSVLCPSLGSGPYVLTNDPYGQRDLLAIEYDGSYLYYDHNGYYVSAKDTETANHQPSLFHDTPTNRAAIATLYGSQSTGQACTRFAGKQVVMPAGSASDMASGIASIIEHLADVQTLALTIRKGKQSDRAQKAILNMINLVSFDYEGMAYHYLESLNESLALAGLDKVEISL